MPQPIGGIRGPRVGFSKTEIVIIDGICGDAAPAAFGVKSRRPIEIILDFLMNKSYIYRKAKGISLLTQTANYALRAIGFIAHSKPGEPVLAAYLSEELKIPRNYLSKILHQLVKAGYLESKRGTNGGFLLAKEAGQITVKEIAALFMNIDQFDYCFLGEKKCDGSCGLHRQWQPIISDFKKLINHNTIDKLYRRRS